MPVVLGSPFVPGLVRVCSPLARPPAPPPPERMTAVGRDSAELRSRLEAAQEAAPGSLLPCAQLIFQELLLSLPAPPPPPLPFEHFKRLFSFLQKLPSTHPTLRLLASPPSLEVLNFAHTSPATGRVSPFAVSVPPPPAAAPATFSLATSPALDGSPPPQLSGPLLPTLSSLLSQYALASLSLDAHAEELSLLSALRVLDPPLPSPSPRRRLLLFAPSDARRERPLSFELSLPPTSRPRLHPPAVRVLGAGAGPLLASWREFAGGGWDAG
ncbi:hypothetical protein TeGR_g6057, partial [Tetraparma gracilis]